MGCTNDEESDFEGFELKDIVKDEDANVNLNDDILHQFDFFFFFFEFFFFTFCVTLQPRNDDTSA